MQLHHDKTLHVAVGFASSLVVSAWLGPPYGFMTSTLLGLGKEIYDYFHPAHTCDLWDLVATMAGGGYGSCVVAVMK